MQNFAIPHNLKQAILENRLLVFIGAGLSKSVGLPLWKDIVIKTLNDPAVDKGKAYVYAIESGIMTPLEVLDKIESQAKKEIYSTFEEETSRQITSPIYKVIREISGKLITTNYDKLIESNCSIPVISPNSIYSLRKVDDNSEFLLKIHGDCSEIDNAVIFTSDYRRLYEEPDGLAKFQLDKLVSSHTCLFLGFSMSDNYVSRLFDRLNEMYNGLGRDHYAVSTEMLVHATVKTIKINTYDELPDFLAALSHVKTETQPLSDTRSNDAVGYESLPASSTLVQNDPDLNDVIQIKVGNDAPPITEYWTGRSEEIKSLKSPHKVCFITGIGGQGKSALASKLLSESYRDNYDILDWRDFKEEELNFQSKLYQLIELVSRRALLTNDLIGLDTEVLVDIFFEKLASQKGVFVFDNIDKYIDLEKFTPTGDIAYFFEKALKTAHRSKFVFTCRPFIHHAGIGFYQVQLEGLEFDDVKRLIQKYHQHISEADLHGYALRLHAVTKGHPLWMGLILAQSRNSLKEIDDILEKISAHHDSVANVNLSAIISRTILEDVWNKLKDREKIILRTLSISSIAEKEDDLAKIVERKLNYNQFSKAMKSLRSFNLIVQKEGEGYIELHPLVREFIKANYAREQQENFIALYVSYLDGFICLIKEKLGRVLAPDDIELVIKKIEILINADKLSDAAAELRVTCESLRVSGYCEEFIRLCDMLLSKNIWTSKKISAISGFHKFMHEFLEATADFGRHDLFDKYLATYVTVFPNADKNMILVKSALCYRAWAIGNHSEAIKEGKSAADLIDILGDGDVWEGLHRYNLALRDSREPANVNLALKYFCAGKDLDFYLSSDLSEDICGTTYGNIGRALLCLNEVNKALFLITKSYKKLKAPVVSYFSNHNIGYAAKWIYETLILIQRPNDALYFMIYARNLWKNDIPEEANKLERELSKIPQNAVVQSIVSLESWQVSKYCDDWVNNSYKEYAATLLLEKPIEAEASSERNYAALN